MVATTGGCRRVNEGVSGRPAATANGVTSTLLRLLSLSAFVRLLLFPVFVGASFSPFAPFFVVLFTIHVYLPYSCVCVCDPGP